MMDLAMNFDADECLVTAMFDKGNRNDTMEAIDHIILARELWNILPETELQAFCSLLIEQCHRHCDVLLPNGELTILLITEEGKIIQ